MESRTWFARGAHVGARVAEGSSRALGQDAAASLGASDLQLLHHGAEPVALIGRGVDLKSEGVRRREESECLGMIGLKGKASFVGDEVAEMVEGDVDESCRAARVGGEQVSLAPEAKRSLPCGIPHVVVDHEGGEGTNWGELELQERGGRLRGQLPTALELVASPAPRGEALALAEHRQALYESVSR